MDNFDEKECEEKWKTFNADRGLTVASLVHMAKQYGYDQNSEKEPGN